MKNYLLPPLAHLPHCPCPNTDALLPPLFHRAIPSDSRGRLPLFSSFTPSHYQGSSVLSEVFFLSPIPHSFRSLSFPLPIRFSWPIPSLSQEIPLLFFRCFKNPIRTQPPVMPPVLPNSFRPPIPCFFPLCFVHCCLG